MKTIEDLMREAFPTSGFPRSQEYREGVRALLERRIYGVNKTVYCSYKAGTASYDAFYAGVDGGLSIWSGLDVPSLVVPR